MDDLIQDAINNHAGHLSVLDTAMKLGANDLIFLALPLLLLLWFWPVAAPVRAANQRLALAAAIGAGLALLVAAGVSLLVYQDRPFVSDGSTHLLIRHVADNGFPSDHATVTFALAGALLGYRSWLAASVLLCAIMVALSRVYVGVHWPSDVAAAAIIGLIAGAIAARATPLMIGAQGIAARILPAILISDPGLSTED